MYQTSPMLSPKPVSPPARERRRAAPDPARLTEGLTPAQLATVETMRQFRWTLRFVRRPLFQDPIPVLFDQAGSRYVVVRGDGSIDEQPLLRLRD